MNITLILAACENDPLKKTDPFMPLSLPLLAGSAPHHYYTFVDMLAGETFSINPKNKPDLVGISARITAEKFAFSLADSIRNQGIPVILGGAQISSNYLEAKNHAESVVIGEGEFLFPQLLTDFINNDLKDFYSTIPDITIPDNFTGFKLPQYPDLTQTPSPLRSYYRKSYDFDTVFASRGCPMNCEFCSVSYIFGKKMRFRPVSDVVNEISTFKNYYYILDDTVFGRPANYDYYLELYNKISTLKKINFWTGQANLDAASHAKGREVITAAAKAGLIYAAIGIESINPVSIEKSGIKNKLGVKDIHDVISQMKSHIRFIQEQGIVITGWFTVGFEEDTLDSIKDIYDFCEETNIIPIVNPLEALPGTPLYERLLKEGRINHNSPINITHPQLAPEEILNLIEIENKKAFSNRMIRKRTHFYKKYFTLHSGTSMHKKIEHHIHKSIFTHILQKKLMKGVTGLINEM